MDSKLKEKVAIVTGGGSNIGRGISLALAAEGATVIIAEIDEKQGQQLVKQIMSKGGTAKTIKTDVTDYDSVQRMVKAVLEECSRIDICVNNVGWDDLKPFQETKSNWDKYINLNFRSVLNCMHCILPSMIQRRYGRIVNIGSDAGRVGEYLESVYSGCKAGIIGLSKSVAREVGRYGITINVVCPGATVGRLEEVGEFSMWSDRNETGQKIRQLFGDERQEKVKKVYPLRRLGKPEDVANAVLFLASDAADFITGQTLSVSGGYTMV